uniref:Protein-S-isoprenylcysteine O-methyltransferase n=1 Tax=Panagrellus redivivus TaxID=6233 RepID=A0A7E4VQQ9_PANRE
MINRPWHRACHRIRIILKVDVRVQGASLAYAIGLLYHTVAVLTMDLHDLAKYSVPILLFLAALRKFKHSIFFLQAYFLGTVTAFAGYLIAYGNPGYRPAYICALLLANFHFYEFLVLGLSNPDAIRPSSFLLDHSVAYWGALFAGFAEFFARQRFLFDTQPFITVLGIAIAISGDLIRKMAIWQAGAGFTHMVSYQKKKAHELVTSGIYSYARHPSYLGFFLFSVGTQIALNNVICAPVYAYVCIFEFFSDRIYEEERYLIEFFGPKYRRYQTSVPVGLPFINGFPSVNRVPENE